MGTLQRNLAVLIDFENLVAGCEKEGLGRLDISLVMDRFKDMGRVLWPAPTRTGAALPGTNKP